MPAGGRGLDVSSWGSAEGKDSDSLADRNRIVLKRPMTSYLLYSAECLVFTVKLLIFCVLMDVPSSKSIERHRIREESGCQGHIKQCNLFRPHWRLYNNVDTVKCFNWIYILASNEFIVVYGWAFKLELRTVITNMKISAWVNYLCVSQLIADLIDSKWGCKWGYCY